MTPDLETRAEEIIALGEVRKNTSDPDALVLLSAAALIGAPNVVRDLLAEVAMGKAIIDDLIDWFGVHHSESDCPEDDTCSCPNVHRINEYMKGYKRP